MICLCTRYNKFVTHHRHAYILDLIFKLMIESSIRTHSAPDKITNPTQPITVLPGSPFIIFIFVICLRVRIDEKQVKQKHLPLSATFFFLCAKALARAPANPASPPPVVVAVVGALGSDPGTAAALRSFFSVSATFRSLAPPRMSARRPSRPAGTLGSGAVPLLGRGGGGGPPDDGSGGGGGAPDEGN